MLQDKPLSVLLLLSLRDLQKVSDYDIMTICRGSYMSAPLVEDIWDRT